MEGATQELRQALSTPPPHWNHHHHHGGGTNSIATLHASLEHLRNTGDERYLFLRTLLDVLAVHGFLGSGASANKTAMSPSMTAMPTPLSGEEEQILFHCATGLRHVLLFRWEMFRPSFRCCVRDFLLAVGLGCFNDCGNACDKSDGFDDGVSDGGDALVCLPRTVAMACLSGAASLWKRGWVSTSSYNTDNDETVIQEDSQQMYLESLIVNTLLPQMQRFNGITGMSGREAAQELFVYLNYLVAYPFIDPSKQFQPQMPIPILMQQQQRKYTAAMASSFLSLLVVIPRHGIIYPLNFIVCVIKYLSVEAAMEVMAKPVDWMPHCNYP